MLILTSLLNQNRLMNSQYWNAEEYSTNAAYVAKLGNSVLEILAPKSGERILDLGCGDGKLTLEIQNHDCNVLGIDSSEEMINATRKLGIEANVMSGENLNFTQEFDAVFSNAALHWMRSPEQVTNGVYQALKPGGRFVGEFGGKGNINSVITSISEVFEDFPHWGKLNNPWYFPSVIEYAKLLDDAGFEINYLELIPRPTSLEMGIRGWLKVFANGIINHLNAEEQEVFIDQIEKRSREIMFSQENGWVADYVRLRFKATKIK